jgi:NADPH2:quinone reductase
MRAAVIEQYGQPPSLKEHADPTPDDGRAVLVEVTAAGLNPVDISIASGKFYAGSPTVPYVPGEEGVGRVLQGGSLSPGTRVYFQSVRGHGSLAQRALAQVEAAVELPEGVSDELAVCFGIAGLAAWLALEWRARLQKGERVLVLGASGVVGMIAVQAARLLGAGRVVAAARDKERLQRARQLGADATVDLASSDGLVDAIKQACDGGPDVIVDPLWGAPAAAALQAARPHARLVQIGQSAGAEVSLASAWVRGKMIVILGHTNYLAPAEVRKSAYRAMVEHAAEGRLTADLETIPLDQVKEAWQRQTRSPHRKLVLCP